MLVGGRFFGAVLKSNLGRRVEKRNGPVAGIALAVKNNGVAVL